jgi:hypothetical protein
MMDSKLMKAARLILIAALAYSTAVVADTTPSATAAVDAEPGAERTFATQAGLDWYLEQQRITNVLAVEHALAQLHLMQDEVTAEGTTGGNGREASVSMDELERIAAVLTAPGALELLEASAYYAEVIQGRAPVTK